MIDQRVGSHFWLSEFLRSEIAVRHGIDNTPPAAALANLVNILGPAMQRVRDALGAPVLVTSGFRCQAVERVLKRQPADWYSASQHVQGLAADFVCPQFGTSRVVARYLMERSGEIRFDQLIYEGNWVHASFVALSPRSQVLTAHFVPGGGVSYTPGLV